VSASPRSKNASLRSKLNPNAQPFVPALRSSSEFCQVQAPNLPLKFDAGAANIPHPAKQHKGGEDAYFVATNSSVIGIADGVGGWEAHGIDSGLYSRSLMMCASEAADTETQPLKILKEAHGRCTDIQGSSTACILSLVGNQLSAANLGDSGFILLRKGQLIFKTKEQQHYFNCPLQLGCSRDQPEHSDQIVLQVEEGDILVIATDGLFDNIFTDRIIQLTEGNLQLSSQDLAQSLAEEAHRVGADPDAYSPFQEGARKAGQTWQGGKLDDVTVIVARIKIDSYPAGTVDARAEPEPQRD